LKNAQIQRAAIRFRQPIPETGANRLQDYGVSILTSAAPGKSADVAKLSCASARRKLQNVRKRDVRRQHGGRIGRTCRLASPCIRRHHDAVLAGHLCVQLEKDILFYDERAPPKRACAIAAHRAGGRLSDAFRSRVAYGRDQSWRAISTMRLVLVWSTERIEVCAASFCRLLFTLIKNIHKGHLLRTKWPSIWPTFEPKIEAAPSVYR